ncbi:MAG TPA: hypothetical protein VIW48_07200 [Nitrospiraceae bacterium]
MLRTSMRNFVRMTVPIVVVLIGREIGSAAASEPLPNLRKHLMPPQGIGFSMSEQGNWQRQYFFNLDVNYT